MPLTEQKKKKNKIKWNKKCVPGMGAFLFSPGRCTGASSFHNSPQSQQC